MSQALGTTYGGTTYDAATARQRLNTYARTKYQSGRDLTENEFGELTKRVNYTGGPINDDLMGKAYGHVDDYARSQGWQAPAGPTGVQTAIPGYPGGPNDVATQIPNEDHQARLDAPPNTSFGPPGGTGGPEDTLNQSVWARLNALINQKPGYDPADPENRMQLDVQRSNSQRSAERRRSSAAERAGADGTLSSGSFDTTVDGILAARGMEDASFESQLASSQLQRQRDETMQALQMGAGLLDSSQTRQLQERLGLLDAAIRREGIGSQERLGNLDATLRRYGIDSQNRLGQGDLRARLLQILLGNQNANDRLGFDYTQLEALMNQALFGQLR